MWNPLLRPYWRILSQPLAETFIVGGITITTRYVGEGEFETRVRHAPRRIKPHRTQNARAALDYHADLGRELTPPLTGAPGRQPSRPPSQR
jgi:hypothetical protein